MQVTARQAILGLTQSVACEYATADVRVSGACQLMHSEAEECAHTQANMITAGPCEAADIATSFVKQIFTSVSQVKEKIPMRRLGNPSEVAKVAVFLLSPASSYVTVSQVH